MITNDDVLALLADVVHSGSGVRIPVSGRSMGPAYALVSDIQVVPCEPSSITPGRLVVFQRNGKWVVHRVMRRMRGSDGEVCFTKGDGVAQLDRPCVQASEIKGVVSVLRFKDGSSLDLLAFPSRLRAWWIVTRFWMGRFILPTGRDPRLANRG